MVRIFRQVLDGVSHIHSKNVIHRDLKPENILLDESCNAKVADFGCATEISNGVLRQTFCGTYEYMAPEIFESEEYSTSVDIWALGILLYEMLHGNSPYAGKSMFHIYKNIIKNSISFSKELDPLAEQLLKRILQMDPAKRPSLGEIMLDPFILKYSTLQESIVVSSSKKESIVTNFSKSKMNEFEIKKRVQQNDQVKINPDLNSTVKTTKVSKLSKFTSKELFRKPSSESKIDQQSKTISSSVDKTPLTARRKLNLAKEENSKKPGKKLDFEKLKRIFDKGKLNVSTEEASRVPVSSNIAKYSKSKKEKTNLSCLLSKSKALDSHLLVSLSSLRKNKTVHSEPTNPTTSKKSTKEKKLAIFKEIILAKEKSNELSLQSKEKQKKGSIFQIFSRSQGNVVVKNLKFSNHEQKLLKGSSVDLKKSNKNFVFLSKCKLAYSKTLNRTDLISLNSKKK